ncbi:MAG TPA: FtsX-like permease family protein [Chitinophagaceae bacterium]|nr:FtsX-like permease family protein [Chitinophagaceae bacterium]
MKALNFLFAWRYFKARKSTNAINIIAWVSVVAMAFGTAALILSLSVFNGFEDLVKSLYSDFYTDLRVIPAQGKILRLTPQQRQAIAQWPGVKALSMTVEEKAMVQNGEVQSTLVFVKGVDDNYPKTSGVPGKMVRGKFLPGTADHPGAILGAGVENALGVESDRAILPLALYLPKKELNVDMADPLQSLSSGNIVTSGAFAIQQDFDNNYLITNLDFVKRQLNLGPDEYGAAEIALSNTDEREGQKLRKGLQQMLGKDYIVQTRYEQNRSLYTTMQTEKWFIFVLLSFILVVAAFTMIGALTMLVLEKQKDIQILKAMGSNSAAIQKIFLSEGMLLALIGGGGGVCLAFLVGWLQVKFKLLKLEGNTFLIDYYPVKFLASDVTLVFFTVVLIALLASWFPSRKAAAQPVELKS